MHVLVNLEPSIYQTFATKKQQELSNSLSTEILIVGFNGQK
jgi:hypothetical protein